MADTHSHKCRGCGHIWEHERLVDVSEEVYRQAHLCPTCGKEQRSIYFASRGEEDAYMARKLGGLGLPAGLAKLLVAIHEVMEEDESEQVS